MGGPVAEFSGGIHDEAGCGRIVSQGECGAEYHLESGALEVFPDFRAPLRVARDNDGKGRGRSLADGGGDEAVLTGMGAGCENDGAVFSKGIQHLLELRTAGWEGAAAGIELQATGDDDLAAVD